jgi:hypothetical protein
MDPMGILVHARSGSSSLVTEMLKCRSSTLDEYIERFCLDFIGW